MHVQVVLTGDHQDALQSEVAKRPPNLYVFSLCIVSFAALCRRIAPWPVGVGVARWLVGLQAKPVVQEHSHALHIKLY
jgi:hypothetical protein